MNMLIAMLLLFILLSIVGMFTYLSLQIHELPDRFFNDKQNEILGPKLFDGERED